MQLDQYGEEGSPGRGECRSGPGRDPAGQGADRANRSRHRSLTGAGTVDGKVLQVNVRPGEYVGTPPSQASWCWGTLSAIIAICRVDIDENDIPRAYPYFKPGYPAVASPGRSNAASGFQFASSRIEPYVIPKKSLTRDNTSTSIAQSCTDLSSRAQQARPVRRHASRCVHQHRQAKQSRFTAKARRTLRTEYKSSPSRLRGKSASSR